MPTKAKKPTDQYLNPLNGTRFVRNEKVEILSNSAIALMASKPIDCIWVVADPLEFNGRRESGDQAVCYLVPTRKNGALRAPNSKNLVEIPNVAFETLVKNGTFKVVKD